MRGLAIATITAVLKNLLANRLVEISEASGLGDVSVTALPPDRIATGPDEKNQINVFMHRVTPHTRADLSVGEFKGAWRFSLDLYYLITAYGSVDLHGDILLGAAMGLMNEIPVLSNSMIKQAIGSDSPKKSKGLMGSAEAAIAGADISGLIEISIRPEFTSFEEMSKLWSAFQTRYRPSVTYRASAVAIEVRN